MNKPTITSVLKVYHDPEWKIFLQELPNQEAKDLACKTMSWIKDKYGEVVNHHWKIIKKMNILQGELDDSLGVRLKESPVGYVETVEFHRGIIIKLQALQEEFVEAISGHFMGIIPTLKASTSIKED